MRALVLSLFLFCLPGLVSAQSCGTLDLLDDISPEDRARLDALVAPYPFPEGHTFLAEKPGSRVTVVGTIHVPDPRLEVIAEGLRDEVAKADLLILEASTSEQNAFQNMAAEQPDVFFLVEGPTLIDLLSEDEWAMVTERLGAIGVPGFFAAKFKPWYLAMTLAIPPCMATEMLAGGKGLDAQLEDVALANEVPIATLDDLNDLLQLLAGDPLDKQLEGLRLALQMQEDGDAMTSTLIERYFDGKIRETWEFSRLAIEDSGMENGMELFDEMNQALLVGRNEKWEPKIASLVEGKTAVLAVGAAHLSGEDGVLRSLERAGFTVTRLAP